MTDDASARRAARDLWSAIPAGTNLPKAERGTPAFFDEMTRTRYTLQPWHPELLRKFRPTGRLLEIGCGAGTDHFELATMARETYAVDLAQEGVDLTNARLRLAGLPPNAIVADAESLPFPNGYFDEVYSFGVIHHTDHPELIAAEMARVMRPGGRFLVGVYHRYSIFAAFKLFSFLTRHRREGWQRYIAGIEGGAAELGIQPTIRLFSRREARALFRSTGFFEDVSTSVIHTTYAGHHFNNRIMAPFGWYVIVTGRRS